MPSLPGAPQSHLHPHHQLLPAEYQTTDEARAAADEYYNPPQPSSTNMSSSSAEKLSLTSTLPIPRSTYTMPRLGFGIYRSPTNVCVKSCLTALRSGYRHIDSAQFYGNETEMGEAVRQSGIPRSEIFLTTKILSAGGSPEKSYQKCLDSVRKIDGEEEGGYVDLFLIHSPSGGKEAVREMWQALERLVEEGKVRSVGVSNFGKGQIEGMKAYAKIWPPQVNQIELHPWCQQRTITSYCTSQEIIIQAYCPLVRNLKAHDKTLLALAEKHRKSTGQILIRYCLQKGWVPLPKSDTEERILANRDVYGGGGGGAGGGQGGWEGLEEGDMEKLDALDEGSEGAIVEAVRNE
ncbi:MAG: hypothetical protein LQ350_006506 [Teloschistes chrysophthalmus]|nr:MAG: hypothetical protein LQ350_006506 [Niorma chrysophthalma]